MPAPPPQLYSGDPTETLADLRTLVSHYPAALYGDARELATLLRRPEFEVEEARRWLVEDGLEVVA